MRTLITTTLIIVASFFSFAQSNSFRYSFEVDTLIDISNKSFLSDFTDQLYIHSRNVTGKHSFEITSSEDFTQEQFSEMINMLGSNLVTFNKTVITKEYFGISKNGGQDCPNAELVCDNSNFSGNSSGFGDQELTGSNEGCLSGENQSAWYYIHVDGDGTLEMAINPNGSADYDFAIWGPFDENTANANCPPESNPIRCSWALDYGSTGMMEPYWGQTSSFGCGFLGFGSCSGWITSHNNEVDISEGSGGDGWVRALDVEEGEVYIMLIDNYSVSTVGYDVDWGGTSSLGCEPVVLPVELLDFKVSNQKTHNLLEWSTASEKNNDYFQIEHSIDGQNWQKIGEIKGAGTTTSNQYYSATHKDYPSEINYYRLIQVDYDGTVNKHKIISIDNSEDRYLVKKVNSLGQQVGDDYKGVVFEYYSDGSTRKVMQ